MVFPYLILCVAISPRAIVDFATCNQAFIPNSRMTLEGRKLCSPFAGNSTVRYFVAGKFRYFKLCCSRMFPDRRFLFSFFFSIEKSSLCEIAMRLEQRVEFVQCLTFPLAFILRPCARCYFVHVVGRPTNDANATRFRHTLERFRPLYR